MLNGGTLTVETSNVDVDEDYAANWAELNAGRYVRIRVSDTGSGIDPGVVGKIFDPFFTTKPIGEGTGLGLATVHGIVKQAGGSMHVYTEHGVGTSMSVLLPATDQHAEKESKERVGALGGEEIALIIEDEGAIREMMRRILSRHGYAVIIALSGADAIEIAADKSVEIDVVITDVVMPGMMGREVSERMSEVRPETPLIYVSGYARGVLDAQGRLEPGRALLEKPFSESELLTVVREALDGRNETSPGSLQPA
jgi:CheY-like chemotaxis protein